MTLNNTLRKQPKNVTHRGRYNRRRNVLRPIKMDDAFYIIKSQPKTCDMFEIVKLKFQDVSQDVLPILAPIYTTNVFNHVVYNVNSLDKHFYQYVSVTVFTINLFFYGASLHISCY